MRTSIVFPSSHREKQHGFTMVELMVASAISLMILAGISGLFLASSSSEKTNASTAEIVTNGRYALEVLRRDLLHAGYRGITWAQPSTPTTVIGTINNECGTGFAVDLRQGIWGSNDANPYSANCIPNASYSTGDVLVVRQAALTTVGATTTNGIYFRSSYERGEVFKGTNAPATFTQLPRYDYALEAKAYYVSPYTNSATENPRVPALKRASLGATGSNVQPAMNEELVASNVEDMQFQYGRLKTDGKTQFYNAGNISASTTPSEWDDVVAVRVWLLIRASTPEAGYANTSTYTLGDKDVAVNDGYRREVFSTTVQLRNH